MTQKIEARHFLKLILPIERVHVGDNMWKKLYVNRAVGAVQEVVGWCFLHQNATGCNVAS